MPYFRNNSIVKTPGKAQPGTGLVYGHLGPIEFAMNNQILGRITRQAVERCVKKRALAGSEKQFWSFFDKLPVAAVVVSGERITRANGSFLDMFGYSDRSEVESTPLPGHFAPSSRPGLAELLRGGQAEGRLPCNCNATAHGGDGSMFPVCITARHVVTPDGPALACFLLEASERK